MKILLSSIICLFASSSLAQFNARTDSWLKLMRYQKTLFGFKSEVDSTEYFLSKDGKYSPEKELQKTLSLFNDKERRLEFICKFPARATLLRKNKLIDQTIELEKCDKYQDFKSKINLDSVSLVFSSYFIQKPASAFGHTFFRLSTKENQNQNDLLDYGVDFSAQVTTKNPIVYGVKGILGGFKGRFKLMPYYYKIREYNDMESRDLWDYKLNLTKEDIDFFVAHLFEMEYVHFDYYYFDENCSYHILSFINAIKPEWKLTESLSYFVPPVDTIYALKGKDIIRDISYRPSKYKSLEKHLEMFNKKEFKLFKKLAANKIEPSSLPANLKEKEKVNILDAYSDYIEYKYAKDIGQKNENYKRVLAKKIDINLSRSLIKNTKSSIKDYTNEFKNSPEKGHKTRRVQFSLFSSDHYIKEQTGYEFQFRFALHDFLENKKGYIPYATSELGKLTFSQNSEQNFRVDNFTVANVEALRPLNSLEKDLSWRFQLGVKDLIERRKQDAAIFIDVSLGYSILVKDTVFSLLLRTENNLHNSLDNKIRSSLGPEVLIVYNMKQMAYKLNFGKLFYTKSPYLNELNYTNVEGRWNFQLNSSIFLRYQNNDYIKNKLNLGYSLNF